jgi:hypothetical protein
LRHLIPLIAAAVLLAGCGGTPQPRLARADADRLIALVHRIAVEGACAQVHDIPKLRAQAVALVNERRVPTELQEQLVSAVNALGAETPVCLPAVPAAATTTTVERSLPPVPVKRARPHPHPHAPKPPGPHGHGHGHGHP